MSLAPGIKGVKEVWITRKMGVKLEIRKPTGKGGNIPNQRQGQWEGKVESRQGLSGSC